MELMNVDVNGKSWSHLLTADFDVEFQKDPKNFCVMNFACKLKLMLKLFFPRNFSSLAFIKSLLKSMKICEQPSVVNVENHSFADFSISWFYIQPNEVCRFFCTSREASLHKLFLCHRKLNKLLQLTTLNIFFWLALGRVINKANFLFRYQSFKFLQSETWLEAIKGNSPLISTHLIANIAVNKW